MPHLRRFRRLCERRMYEARCLSPSFHVKTISSSQASAALRELAAFGATSVPRQRVLLLAVLDSFSLIHLNSSNTKRAARRAFVSFTPWKNHVEAVAARGAGLCDPRLECEHRVRGGYRGRHPRNFHGSIIK